MISEEAKKISAQCRHYAMCKIDFLGTGLCPAGKDYHYVSYYPQGRMDIYHALANDLIPVTERLIEIANTCTLCGICDKQCYFVTQLRPMKVMKALKDYVEFHLSGKKDVKEIPPEPFLTELQKVVGERWATNDPAVLVAYAHDPCPVSVMQMPKYVVMPRTKAEVGKIITLCHDKHVPYVARGNGSSVMGFVLSAGIVVDVNRMKDMSIDRDNWAVAVGPGVTAFELQKEVTHHGYRVNVAEPAASVCGNIICSGIFSTFSHAYGTAADNVITAEFVDPEGRAFTLNEKTAPNLFSFQPEGQPCPGICTEALVKLYPTTDDEEGILVPFASFEEALFFIREISMRRIGLSAALLGAEYTATFMSPSRDVAHTIKPFLQEELKIRYLVSVIGDQYAMRSIKETSSTFIDNRLFRTLMLGLPRLADTEWEELIGNFDGDRYPYEFFCKQEMYPILEAALSPSPAAVGECVDDDLRAFYTDLYSKSEMTDLRWLTMFRIVSSRMGREKHVVAFIVYVPLDKPEIIVSLNSEFKRIADNHKLKNDFGFITPLDFGKRAVLEYDYYLDHTSSSEKQRMQHALIEAGDMIETASRRYKGVKWIRYLLYQGFSRKEHFLYT
ncbi:MAG: FAD-binding oxidoreductase [Deltaproteobacteria bacterium]|nr:FAD-binding oxidoreductase [Deltaproteobacteria bacterium]